MAQTTKTDKVIIKKYANRRLYNTAKSSYVTLEDLAEMVRKGEDFAVFDAKTGVEITRSVLTQIIVEEEGKDQNMLPTNFLRELIRLYGDPLQAVVPGYLDAAMEAFSRNQVEMRDAFTSGTPFGNLESMTRANMEFMERSMRMFTPFAGVPDPAARAKPAPSAPKAAPADVTDDLDALQTQLREMQEKLSALSEAKAKAS